MFVDKNLIDKYEACETGTEWFTDNFPNGAEHLVVMNKLKEEDKYSWFVWLKDAVTEELIIKEKAPLFKVGDTVRIRAWDDMEKEYGVDNEGDIATYSWFTKGMGHLCGLEFTIEEIEHYHTQEFLGHLISIDMLEKIEEPNTTEANI